MKLFIRYVPAFAVLFFCCFINASAQDHQNNFAITPIEGIKIFAPENDPLTGSFYGLDAAYRLNMSNNEDRWIKKLHVKDIAITARYLDLQNIYFSSNPATKGFLGSTYSAFTILDIALWQKGSTMLLFSPGVGLTYDTKTYYNDVYNSLVGSHLNLGINAGLKLETPISPATRIALGFNAFHYSNSGSKLPNYGITGLDASLGISTDLSHPGPERETAHFSTGDENSWEFAIGFGRRGVVQTNSYVKQVPPGVAKPIDSAAQRNAASHLYQMAFYGGYNYRLNALVSLKAGADLFYYFRPFNPNDFAATYQASGSSYDHFAVGTSLGADLWLGRLVFSGNYGYYLHYSSITPQHTYWDLGGKYYLNKWVALNAKIYLHGTEAQYANFGVVFNVY